MNILQTLKNLVTRNKNPTEVMYQLVSKQGNGIWEWNGKLYESDMLRAIIRPFVISAGKFTPKQLKGNGKDVQINSDLYIQFLLRFPNPILTGQKFREKLAWQYMLNGNAFALILRDDNGYAVQAYPINAYSVQAKYDDKMQLFLEFVLENGKTVTYPYTDVIHVPRDLGNNELFGSGNMKTLEPLMQVVTASDGSIISAIQNSGVIKWLLKYSRSMRPEELKTRAQEFADNFLDTTDNKNVGVAATGADADAIQIAPNDYVPNALLQDRTAKRVLEYFNTNEKIVMSTYSEDEWNAYYESVIEPFAVALGEEFTRKVFTRREIGYGNQIIFDSTNLQYASMATKLAMVSMVDRGAMTPNQWRAILNMGPTGTPEGDLYLRRLDTGIADQNGGKKQDATQKPTD